MIHQMSSGETIPEMKSWSDLSPLGGQWDTVLLGNGASIALHGDFHYRSLYDMAKSSLSSEACKLFECLDTLNFEHVLRAICQAGAINKALGIDTARFDPLLCEIRNALIAAVQRAHCEQSVTKPHTHKIGRWLESFASIVTFNYDVTLYWISLDYNEHHGGPRWFVDRFGRASDPAHRDRLVYQESSPARPRTIFYAHGSLLLARDADGNEYKIKTAKDRKFLTAISERWAQGHTPIFVSEGTDKEKMETINKSRYLRHVYDEVLCKQGDKCVAIYGLSLDPADQHVLDALAKSPPRQMAISIFTGAGTADKLKRDIYKRIKDCDPLSNVQLDFFDSQSPGCWLHAPPDPTIPGPLGLGAV
jgi:hypothetical protein